LAAKLLFGRPRIGSGIRHDEPGSSLIIKRRIEKLYPKVIRVIRTWQTKWESPVFSNVTGQPLLINRVYVKRRIREEKVKLSSALVQVFVVSIRFADVALQSVDGEVHPAKFHRFSCFFLTVD